MIVCLEVEVEERRPQFGVFPSADSSNPMFQSQLDWTLEHQKIF